MNWFPQTGSGSITQFPFHRRNKWRTISNELENGEWLGLPDPAADRIEWQLTFKDLNDDEAARLRALFVVSKGTAGSFGFTDPVANLLAWSEALTHADWQAGLLYLTPGVTDPENAQKAWSITNNAPGAQSLSQTVGVPGDYVGCFSAWVRSAAPGSITLQRDNIQSAASAGPVWKQVFVSGAGNPGTTHSTVSVALNAGQTIEVWGLQFEAQPYASQYKPSAAGNGIYQETYFANDELTMTCTGVGLTACEISLVSRL